MFDPLLQIGLIAFTKRDGKKKVNFHIKKHNRQQQATTQNKLSTSLDQFKKSPNSKVCSAVLLAESTSLLQKRFPSKGKVVKDRYHCSFCVLFKTSSSNYSNEM